MPILQTQGIEIPDSHLPVIAVARRAPACPDVRWLWKHTGRENTGLHPAQMELTSQAPDDALDIALRFTTWHDWT
jgi:hypothetical protein